MAGNFTKPPEGLSPDSPHRNWAEDQLLPRAPDGNGFATGIMAPGGWVARTDAEGKEWGDLLRGFRNAYDLAFNLRRRAVHLRRRHGVGRSLRPGTDDARQPLHQRR